MFTCRGEDLCYLVAPRPLSSIFQGSTDFTPLLCSSILLDGRRVGVALNATIIIRAFFSIDTETDSFSENRYNSGLKRWFRTIESPLFILPSFFLIFFFLSSHLGRDTKINPHPSATILLTEENGYHRLSFSTLSHVFLSLFIYIIYTYVRVFVLSDGGSTCNIHSQFCFIFHIKLSSTVFLILYELMKLAASVSIPSY